MSAAPEYSVFQADGHLFNRRLQGWVHDLCVTHRQAYKPWGGCPRCYYPSALEEHGWMDEVDDGRPMRVTLTPDGWQGEMFPANEED